MNQLWRGGPHVQLVDYAISPWVDPRNGIILSGFWRSGTTWVQQMLSSLIGAKTIFEPLDSRITGKTRRHPCPEIDKMPQSFQKTFMPFRDGSLEKDRDFQSHMDRALRARLPGRWVRRARTRSSETFRRKVVVKLVRGQLCLNALHKTFRVPVVHIYRDPRAVAASVIRAGWGNGWLTQMDLRELLLRPKDGRYEYFNQWEDLIEGSVNLDPVIKIATYWALTERFVLDKSVSNFSKIALIRYEDLSKNPCDSLAENIVSIGVDVDDRTLRKTRELTVLSSPTSGEKRAKQAMSQKMRSWKIELDTSQIESIEKVVSDLGFSNRLVD